MGKIKYFAKSRNRTESHKVQYFLATQNGQKVNKVQISINNLDFVGCGD